MTGAASMAERLKWRRVGCAYHTTNAECKFGKGFRTSTGKLGVTLVGMGLHFGTFDSKKTARANAQRIWNSIKDQNRHPVGIG